MIQKSGTKKKKCKQNTIKQPFSPWRACKVNPTA